MNNVYTDIVYLSLYGAAISKVQFSVLDRVKMTLTGAIPSSCSDIISESLKDE